MSWQFNEANSRERELFASLAMTWCSGGQMVNTSRMSTLYRVSSRSGPASAGAYYVKLYQERGRGLRRYLGRSRVRAEWENLLRLRRLGVPTVRAVAYGEDGRRGALVTAELPGAMDLRRFVAGQLDRDILGAVIGRLSRHVRAMHRAGFVHGDLKWRNILVTQSDEDGFKPKGGPEVHIIDSPQGRWLPRVLRHRGVIKDLACLDKVARKRLSRTQRLRFFLEYRQCGRLGPTEKKEIAMILKVFEGRE